MLVIRSNISQQFSVIAELTSYSQIGSDLPYFVIVLNENASQAYNRSICVSAKAKRRHNLRILLSPSSRAATSSSSHHKNVMRRTLKMALLFILGDEKTNRLLSRRHAGWRSHQKQVNAKTNQRSSRARQSLDMLIRFCFFLSLRMRICVLSCPKRCFGKENGVCDRVGCWSSN